MSDRTQFTDAGMFGVGITLNGRHLRLEDFFMTKELPLYTCHKKVRALEVRSIGAYSPDASGKVRREVIFADPDFPPIWVSGDLFTRYIPVGGDYYVVYDDGYASFSPRKVFLDGYSLTQDGNVLMERLNDLSTILPGSPPEKTPDWLRAMDWSQQIARVAREAYVTINSLKFLIEQLKADATITRQMAGFKEVKK